MTWAQLTMRVFLAGSLAVCAIACGDENESPPPAARKPVSRGEAASGSAKPMPRDADGAMREDASALDGGGGDASLGDASLGDAGVDQDASSLPMMLRDGGPNAGTGGIGGAGTGGVGGLGGLGGEGGIGAIGGTFQL